jgi:large subunit ribosomal protein L25
MESIEIKGTSRTTFGKKSSKELRKSKSVPCVLYGGKENVHFSTDETSFKDLVFTPNVYEAKIDVDGKIYRSILKDVQYHAVSDDIIHADFYEVDDKKKVDVFVPVRLEGFSVGVKEGGKLILDRRKLKVRGFLKEVPQEIVLDITNLGLGKSLRVNEVTAEGVELLDPKNSPVATVKMTRAARGAQAEAEKKK